MNKAEKPFHEQIDGEQIQGWGPSMAVVPGSGRFWGMDILLAVALLITRLVRG